MANLKFGNTNIGKISIIEPYEYPYDTSDPVDNDEWIRPAEWLDMPTIGEDEEKTAILMACISGVPLDVSLRFFGTNIYNNYRNNPMYSVIDWGDGTSVVHSGNSNNSSDVGYIPRAEHSYDFNDLPENTEFYLRGQLARQVLIQVDSSVSGVGEIDLNGLGGFLYTADGRSGWTSYSDTTMLDIHINSSGISNIYLEGTLSYNTNCQRFVFKSATTSNFSLYRKFANFESLRVIDFPSGIPVSDVRNAFQNCRSLKNAPMLNTTNIAYNSADNMFASCYALTGVPLYDTSNWTSFYSTFSFCRSLKHLPDFDTSNVTNFYSVFNSCSSLEKAPDWDYSSSTSFNSAFYECRNLVDARALDFSSATSLYRAFRSCDKLKYVPIINAPNTTDIRECFSACSSIEKLEITTLRSTNYADSFANGCINLKEVVVSSGNAISLGGSCNSLFANCYRLRKAPEMDTSRITNMYNMFASCGELEHVPVYNASGCQNTNYMFQYCLKLKKIGGFTKFYNKNTGAVRMFFNTPLEEFPSGMFVDYNSCPSNIHEFYGNFKEIPDITLSGITTNAGNSNVSIGGVDLEKVNNIEFGPYAKGLFYGKSIVEFPEIDMSPIQDASLMFYSCRNLSRVRGTGLAVNISFYQCYLGSGAITEIFENLASGVSGQTIDIQRNYGAYILHPDTISIATSKGWTVTT